MTEWTAEELNVPEVKPAPHVSVIIINWKSVDLLNTCLRSIREKTRKVRYEVIVADNASFDGCGEMLAESHPWVQFVQLEENMGFAAANNLCARQASGELVLFLNPDTLLANDAVDVMATTLARLPDVGLAGCRLLNADGSLQASCVNGFPSLLKEALDSNLMRRLFPNWRLWGTEALRTCEGLSDVDVVSGACMILPVDVFRQVGGFSEEYFMYSEDVDLCAKVRAQGKRVIHLGAAVITHFGDGSVSKREEREFQSVMLRYSRWRLLAKMRGQRYARAYRLVVFLSAFLRLLVLACALPFLWMARQGTKQTARSLSRWLAVCTWTLNGQNPCRNRR